MEQKNEQKVFCSREWDPITRRSTYKYNGIDELANISVRDFIDTFILQNNC